MINFLTHRSNQEDMRIIIGLTLVLSVFSACNSGINGEKTVGNNQTVEPVDSLLDSVYHAHGELGNYRFVFRDDQYSFQFNEGNYIYSKSSNKSGKLLRDTLTNNGFVRYADGARLVLSKEEEAKYAESLNSVIYFVCLPLKLKDPAANKTKLDDCIINESVYSTIRVHFDEEGGGTDFDDVFYYWINQNTNQVDFIAYKYSTNGGGVRFRSAFNSRMIGKMRFQDYLNYEAPIGKPLAELPLLFEKDSLKILSEIITESVEPIP